MKTHRGLQELCIWEGDAFPMDPRTHGRFPKGPSGEQRDKKTHTSPLWHSAGSREFLSVPQQIRLLPAIYHWVPKHWHAGLGPEIRQKLLWTSIFLQTGLIGGLNETRQTGVPDMLPHEPQNSEITTQPIPVWTGKTEALMIVASQGWTLRTPHEHWWWQSWKKNMWYPQGQGYSVNIQSTALLGSKAITGLLSNLCCHWATNKWVQFTLSFQISKCLPRARSALGWGALQGTK